jgi:hypothetical protein
MPVTDLYVASTTTLSATLEYQCDSGGLADLYLFTVDKRGTLTAYSAVSPTCDAATHTASFSATAYADNYAELVAQAYPGGSFGNLFSYQVTQGW